MLDSLKIKIFSDGADLQSMIEMSKREYVKGLTTNPTLMKKSGVKNYKEFASKVLEGIQDKPISFEVFSDDIEEMERQAIEISQWGKNVNVKIPITNTKGEMTTKIIQRLSDRGIIVNVTALTTICQVEMSANALNRDVQAYVSLFAGRIADTGRDPVPVLEDSLKILRDVPNAELIWASPREILNVIQANEIGCHVITVTKEILDKVNLLGKDLDEYSLDTVKMFHRDAQESGYSL
jgi:transaldolase